jgi:hypothetical protein
MSKNTANIAQAISLLADALSCQVTGDSMNESDEDTDTLDNDEYEDLVDQVLEFGKNVADDLSDISADLDLALDLATEETADDGSSYSSGGLLRADNWQNADLTADAASDDDVDNGDVDINDTDTDDDDTGDDKSKPIDREELLDKVRPSLLEERNAELDKSRLELSDKIEDLADKLRAVAMQIENLNATVDTFVSEVESL